MQRLAERLAEEARVRTNLLVCGQSGVAPAITAVDQDLPAGGMSLEVEEERLRCGRRAEAQQKLRRERTRYVVAAKKRIIRINHQ